MAKSKNEGWAGKALLYILTGLWRLILFLFWVVSSAITLLLKELNDSIRRYLFPNE
jgi:hypothetical protein